MRTDKLPLKVIIQEDDLEVQKQITKDLESNNYNISFFSKREATFDLLMFHPDILIKDYFLNKKINCYEWAN